MQTLDCSVYGRNQACGFGERPVLISTKKSNPKLLFGISGRSNFRCKNKIQFLDFQRAFTCSKRDIDRRKLAGVWPEIAFDQRQ